MTLGHDLRGSFGHGFRFGALVGVSAAVIVVAGCASAPRADPAPPWVDLFEDGSLAGWTVFAPGAGSQPTWTIADGIVSCTGSPAGYLATEGEYLDYELELEWRFDPAKGPGNSGVLLRVQKQDEVWPRSMEAQLQDRRAGDIWNIGDFPARTAPERTSGRHTAREGECAELPIGEWNRYRIIMAGTTMELFVNGRRMNVATEVAEWPGRIALQSEGAFIQFRNARIRPIRHRGESR